MRQTTGATRPSHRLLFAELAQLPLHYFFAKQCIGFYNRIAARKDSIAHDAMVDEVREALACPDGDGWCAKLFRFARAHGVDVWKGRMHMISPEREASRAGSPLAEGPLMSAFRENIMKAWQHERMNTEPATFPSDHKQPGLHMSKYKHWMGLGGGGAAPLIMPPHSKAFIPVAQHMSLMRFRLGCWPLTANRAYGRPRDERICPLCAANEIEDENHVLCRCTAYSQLRECSGLPFEGGIRTVMQTPDQARLAALLDSIWEHRSRSIPLRGN